MLNTCVVCSCYYVLSFENVLARLVDGEHLRVLAGYGLSFVSYYDLKIYCSSLCRALRAGNILMLRRQLVKDFVLPTSRTNSSKSGLVESSFGGFRMILSLYFSSWNGIESNPKYVLEGDFCQFWGVDNFCS